MTKTAIKHKSWCREYQTDYEGEHCFVGFGWGPMRPATERFPEHPHGDVWASQQIESFGEQTSAPNSLTS